MVIVAGTHAVERDGLKSGLYEKLGWHGSERPLPTAGQAVCPVLYQGRQRVADVLKVSKNLSQ